MNQTDEQLARGLAAGSIEAWHALYDAHAEAVWNSVARRVGPHAAVVADIVQETFLLAARSARSFDPTRGTALHWLRGIARTQTALHFRRRQTRPEAAGDDFPILSRETAADPLAEAETAAAVRQVLGTLPADYESLLVGKYLDGLTLDELAQAAGSTAEATSSKLARARRAFREAFHALTGDAPCAPTGDDQRARKGDDQFRPQRVEA
jgi:RNA polymerase sigma-70 factor (ECF subfamily)